MILERLELHNVCQYGDMALDWPRRFTGIFGPNWVGKSNLMRSIRLTLTGASDDTLASEVRYGTQKGETAYARGVWLAGQLRLDLQRSLFPSVRHRLSVAHATTGAKILETEYASEISEYLVRTVHVDPFLVDNYMFVDQWKVFSILLETPAVRFEHLQKLCRTEDAAEIHKALTEVRSSDAPLAVAPDNLATLRKRCVQLKARLRSAAAKAAELRMTAKRRKELEQLATRLSKLQQLSSAMVARESALDRHRGVSAKLATAEQVVDKQKSLLTKAAYMYDKAQLDYDRAIAGRDAIVKRHQARQFIHKLQQRLASLRQPARKAADIPEPIVKNGERAAAELPVLREDRNRLKELLQAVRRQDSDEHICPLCQQPVTSVDDISSKLRTVQSRIEVCETQQSRLAQLRKERESILEEWSEYRRKKQNLVDRLSEAKESFPATSSYRGSVARPASRLVAKAREAQRRIRDALADSEKDLARLQAQATELANELQRLDSLLSSLPRVRDVAKSIKSTSEALQVLQNQAAAFEPARESYMLAKSDFNEAIDEYKEAEAKAARAKNAAAWLATVDTYRGYFGRDGWTRDVHQLVLGRHTQRTNQLLQSCNQPYQLLLTDKNDLRVRTSAGYEHTIRRLSGAQKALLAVCYRVAACQLFAKHIQFLMLDEPTAGVDDRNLPHMANALSRVREVVSDHNLQLVVITHDERLVPYFDDAVHLYEGPRGTSARLGD